MVSQTMSTSRHPAAPLDARELREALLPFGESRMLPRAAYTDEAVFDWERRHFFGDWVCLGLSAELPRPGDQRAEAHGDGSILLVRGSDGLVRAFANTCRHRGHGRELSRVLPLPVDPPRTLPRQPAQERRELPGGRRLDRRPGGSPHGMATMSLDGKSLGVPLRGLSGEQLRTVIYVNIFPNVRWSLHPDYLMTHRMVPLAVNRTRIECSWAFAPEAVARPDFDPRFAVDFWDLTNRQDWAACESVQRGLSTRFASPGPLSPAEDAVYSFVTTVARGYLGEQVL